LAVRFTSGQFIYEYDPTIDDSYRKSCFVDGIGCQIEAIDTAGPEEYSALRDQYLRCSHAFILTCSCTCKASICDLLYCYEQILRVKDQEKVPMVIAMNKTDLRKSPDAANECVTLEELHELLPWVKEQAIPVFETSAKDGTNVDEAFYAACRAYRAEQLQNHLAKSQHYGKHPKGSVSNCNLQ